MTESSSAHTGMWVSVDGFVSLELREDGTFDETRGDQPHVLTGTWFVDEEGIHLTDQHGASSVGLVDREIINAGGYELYRS